MNPAPHRWRFDSRYVLLGIFAYLPLILAAPNRVAADTKQFLYLNPSDLMHRALSLWDPSVGGGSVTHQTIGYLWPMGPFYWVTDQLGLPDWLAQRIWVGSIIFVAAAGTLFLLDRVLPKHWVNVVGAVLYGFSPYVLGHITGQSALLLPFSALPWLAAFMGFAVTRGGWRWPAAFALVVTTAGSLNGSSVFFVVLGAVLWAPMLVATTDDVSWRNAFGAVARAGLLTFITQLWWISAYRVGGVYGLPILAMTETIDVTSATTTAPEILRGLGYWFFYGSDRDGPWLNNIAPLHTTNIFFLGFSFVVPALTLLMATLVRFQQRLYFVLLSVVGLTLAVGAYSASGRSLYGAAFYKLADVSPLLMSLRNTQRATPLLILGLAGLLSAGLHGLAQVRLPSLGLKPQWLLSVSVVMVLALSFPSFWSTGLVGERFHRSSEIPQHWLETADALAGGEGRYWELPGIDFASYRWGHTLDPVLAGLSDRPAIWRELIPSGSPAGADLVGALDRTLQDGTFQPAALAPVARLLGVNEIVLRSDLEYERYRTMRPQRVWEWFKPVPPGLETPAEYGLGYINRAPQHLPMLDELELGLDPRAPVPPAVAVFPVSQVPNQVRAVPAEAGVVIAGSGDGVVAASAAGLLDDYVGPIRYAAEVTASPNLLDEAISEDTTLILTDSNRLRAQHWFSLKDNVGALETPGHPAIPNDVSDARLLPVEPASEASLTVAEFRGAKNVWATGYGNPITLTPEYRAVNAFDGDFNTAWMMSHGVTTDPSIIGIELLQPHSPEQIWLRQETNNPGWRTIHRVAIRLDKSRLIEVDLDTTSLSDQGQAISLDGEPFSILEVEILAAEPGSGRTGFSEITIPGVMVEEIVRIPTDLGKALGPSIYTYPLRIVLNRLWVDPSDVVRADPEERLIRALGLDAPADLTLSGVVRLSPQAPEELIDQLVGIPGVNEGGMTFRSSGRLPSSLGARASAAFDRDSNTAWTSVFGEQANSWIEFTSPRELQLDRLDIELITDARHSVPRLVAIDVDGDRQAVVELPALADSHEPNLTSYIEIDLNKTLIGHEFRFVFLDVDERTTTDWYSGQPIALPIGVAEIAIPTNATEHLRSGIDERCRFDVLSLNAEPIGVYIRGNVSDALEGKPLELALCEEALHITGDDDILRSAPGRSSGFNVDQVVLSNQVGAPETASAVPHVQWVRNSPTSFNINVDAWDEPVWLVVNESWNRGWQASVEGNDLGEPRLHDLWGMGWWIEPSSEATPVKLEWTPQGQVNQALKISLLGVLACIALIVFNPRSPNRGRTRLASTPHFAASGEPVTWGIVLTGLVATSVLISLPWGIGIAAVVTLVRFKPLAQRYLALVPAFFVSLAAAYIVLLQLRWRYPLETVWAEHFDRVHQMTFAAVLIMALLALVDRRGDANTKIAE